MSVYLTAWRELPGHSTGRGTQTEPSSPAELRDKSEFKEAEAARISRIECQRRGRCTELQRPSVDIAWRHVGGCLWLRVCRGNWLYRKAGELLGWRKCFRSWLWWQLTRLETFVKTPWIVHLKLVILYVNYISTRSHPKESSSKIAWCLEII